ncbi:MAG: hypothetical protein SPG10_06945 [Enterocloster clostridioformis]|uniref:hypothetical protein n=1 Tax=Enterocloster clostridioformis TaxID=1531 RepID=UPI0026EB41A4|nr:hypothetical protein [Enterocloster clostridioformis]MDY5476634.1 hypothetical protein [Enterocloster clostridioformis]
MNTEGKKNSLKELLHALESQIKQQDRIISLQEETIKILNEQNDQLMATLSNIIHS